jgi:RHS repeat-associated protein
MTPAGATHYIQDLQGQLIVEATDTGAMLREYVWIDDMPLAVFADLDTASPQLYYVHPDHLNRPLRMTDGAQAVVWDTVYKPFGEVHSITGSATLNLRFPGQYFLIESGLHYNWHRHYDPTLGRYTRPDPMEFVDGSSLYAYALSAPTMEVDQEGLSSFREILRWFRYYQRLYRYGGKSGEEFIKHLRDQREAARRIEKLRERCRLARGKRERDELLEELREELHQYRGHDKEMWQKWPEAMRDLFT